MVKGEIRWALLPSPHGSESAKKRPVSNYGFGIIKRIAGFGVAVFGQMEHSPPIVVFTVISVTGILIPPTPS